MIKKLTDNAYFVVDINSFSSGIQTYDPNMANQTVCLGDDFSDLFSDEPEEKETEDIMAPASNLDIRPYYK